MKPRKPQTAAVPALVHEGLIQQVSFTDDGQRIVSLGADARLRTWDAVSGQAISTFSASRQSYYFALSPDSHQAVVAGGMQTRLVHLATGKGSPAYAKQAYSRSCGFANDGLLVVFPSAQGATLSVMKADTGKLVAQLPSSLLPASLRLMAISSDRSAVVVVVGTGDEVQGGVCTGLHVLEASTLTEKSSIRLPQIELSTTSTSWRTRWTPRGLVLCTQRGVTLVDPFTAKAKSVVAPSGDTTFSNDLILVCDGSCAQVISVANGKKVRRFEVPAQTGAIDSTGSRVALGVRNSVVVYDLKSGSQVLGAVA